MWCVVYAGDGREEKTEEFVRRVLPDSVYTRCFHLVQHRAQKKQGVLRDVPGKYLPGYVFIETEVPETVHEILRETPRKLLFSDNFCVAVLTEKEEALLRLITDEKGEIGISVVKMSGEAEGGKRKSEYLSGPLTKVADRVVYMDFHRRFAEISGDLVGTKKPLKLSFRFDGEICRGQSAGMKSVGRETKGLG